QQIVLERFDKHWRGPAATKNIIVVPVKDNTTRMQRLSRGEVHLVDSLALQDFTAAEKDPKLVAEQINGMNVQYLTIQVDKPPLNNRKVREAIAHAIDKRALVEIGFEGHAQPAVSMVPPTMWGHDKDLVDHPFDLARAKQLLQEAAAEENFKLPL